MDKKTFSWSRLWKSDRYVGLYSPYRESSANYLYNLLFCDDLTLFRNPDETAQKGGVWATLLADKPDFKALEKIASNREEESRLRMLAYNRLRAGGRTVSQKELLGVIVEVPLKQGLDTLAAYPDGRVRYLNQADKAAIIEDGAPEIAALARALVAASQNLVNQIGPWEKKRLAPPTPGNIRLTFLVSDGLYFGEGPFEVLQNDAMGGPILAKATELLQAVVNTAV
jgi:hypothetical protein